MSRLIKSKRSINRPVVKNVKAILFDSGHVLNRPKTGDWFIPPKFNEIMDTSKINTKSIFYIYSKFRAKRYLKNNHDIKTESEEYILFKKFYSILLNKYVYADINDHIISILAEDTVYNDEKFVFFEDVEKSIVNLSNNYLLGIVSSTWPSLKRVFRNKGLNDYFSTFIMSSLYNEYDSKEILLQIALNELKIEPNEAIFIDDHDKHLITAEKLGIIPIKIDRYNKKQRNTFFTIHSLKELKESLINF